MTTQRIKSDVRRTILRAETSVRNELAAELDAQGRLEVAKRYKVVKTWSAESKPKFGYTVLVLPTQISLEVNAKGQNKRIYRWVDEGTEGPYPILPKTPGGRLIFQTGYSAKTAPIAKFDQGTGTASGDWVSSAGVMHPGIAAREFEKTFSKQFKPVLKRAIDQAIRRGLRRKR